ncbi:hypothetical protein E6W39_13480 [Kitasatospora acidiphila]|uniref:Uncharacterized protein n=1 Tax=Kitasatospora acidiphila TaxID=2567942 RepID=A0A540W222_9ACTN|nr:hypothetical protein [Kitasatospora acidiphila]TQF03080.1 hypothetical protein E6W39_13480 [Kitasatospora acidiphila]
MELLLVRTALAPSLVLLASVIARRLGPRRGGQLLGAPTSTGPFLALTWLSSGPEKTAAAAHGTVTGTLVVACFCLAYARLAPTRRPAWTLVLTLAWAAVAGLVGASCGSIWLTAGLTVAVIGAGLLSWPATGPSCPPPSRTRRWEIPVRMALAGATVVTALAAATALGSFVGGVLSALPVLLSVMGTSVHRTAGAPAAQEMMRGALTSAAGTLGFLLVLCFAPVPLGPLAAFLLALAALPTGDYLLRAAQHA